MREIFKKVSAKFRRDGFKGLTKACLLRLSARERFAHPTETILPKLVEAGDFTIIQLGAFEGATPMDPLYGFLRGKREMLLRRGSDRWKLVLVEPVEQHYAKLQENYAFLPGTRFEKVAIADKPGEATFYHLGVEPTEHGYPAWLAQLSSLKSERMGEIWDRYEANPEYKAFYLKHRLQTTVPCWTLAQLFERHDIRTVSLLQMDVEGFEFEIIKTVPFEKVPIRFINFESVLLGVKKLACEQLLHSHGYHMVDFGQDTFCYRPEDGHFFPKWVRITGQRHAMALKNAGVGRADNEGVPR